MIPANELAPQAPQLLLDWLITELGTTRGDRKQLEDDWERWQKAYRARPAAAKKAFPFPGAANLVIPVIATDVDTIVAGLAGTLDAPNALWSMEAIMPEMTELAPRMQEFMRAMEQYEIKPGGEINDWLTEMVLLGTGVLKERYVRETRSVYEWRETPEGVQAATRTMMFKNQPELRHVLLRNLYVPATAGGDIQRAPWCAEYIELTLSQVEARVREGIYDASCYDRLRYWQNSMVTRGDKAAQEADKFKSSMPYGKIGLYELWTDYDVSGQRMPQAVVATVHLESRSYCRLDYNPFFNQEKPYSVARYLRVPGRFYGIGVGEMQDSVQDEVTTMHNQRIDNATIANAQVFKRVRGSTIGIAQVYPGAMLDVETADEVTPMSMGQKYDSTIPNEEMALRYGARRTGVNDYTMGMSTPAIGYGTATTTMQMMQQGGKRSGMPLKEVRRALSESGTRILEMYQQFNPNGKQYVLGVKDGQMVTAWMQFPLELIRRGIRVNVSATDAANNKDMKLRNNVMLMQQLSGFWQQVMQAAQIMFTPGIPPQLQMMAQQAIQGGTLLMRRILDDSSVQDIDRMVPDLQGVQDVNQQLAGLIAAVTQPNGGGAPMAALNPGQPGMAGGGYPAVAGTPTGPTGQLAQFGGAGSL